MPRKNKLTAITAVGLFLMLNGYRLTASQRVLEAFTLEMALRKKDIEAAAEWFRSHSVRKRT